MNKTKAFTLIELLVVISLIDLLSSVVLASLNAAREKGRIAAARQFAANLDHAAGDSAVGIWDFDECSGTTAADRSGFNIGATLVGGAAWSADTPSGAGCSILFDGTDDSVDTAANSALQFNLATDSASWSGWVKTTAGAQQTFLTYSNTYNPRITVNGAYAEWYNAGSINSQAASLNNGLWRHLAVTVEGGQVKIYIDGSLRGSGAAPSSSTANQINIGKKACSGCSDVHFNGRIDSVRVYAKALTASEVGKLYAEGNRLDKTASR